MADGANGCAAARAGLSGPSVNGAGKLEMTAAAVAVDVIAYAAAARRDGFAERGADRHDQTLATRVTDALGGTHWGDAGAKQALSRVDVADAYNQVAIHQHGFDGAAALVQIFM